jgi:hypothetical protein
VYFVLRTRRVEIFSSSFYFGISFKPFANVYKCSLIPESACPAALPLLEFYKSVGQVLGLPQGGSLIPESACPSGSRVLNGILRNVFPCVINALGRAWVGGVKSALLRALNPLQDAKHIQKT